MQWWRSWLKSAGCADMLIITMILRWTDSQPALQPMLFYFNEHQPRRTTTTNTPPQTDNVIIHSLLSSWGCDCVSVCVCLLKCSGPSQPLAVRCLRGPVTSSGACLMEKLITAGVISHDTEVNLIMLAKWKEPSDRPVPFVIILWWSGLNCI